MCADYTPSRKEQIEESFRTGYPLLDLPPEAWPGYMAPILRGSQESPGDLEIAPAMFGMVPHWADLKLARQTYNARTETVASKPSFRNAWKRKQLCIIPAANFFEPNYETGKPVRWRIERADGAPVAIAGIWEYRPADQLLSFSMLTINADGHPLMQRFHKPEDEKRMVMILDPGQYQGWLDGSLMTEEDAYRQYPADLLIAQPDPMQPRSRAKTPTPTPSVDQGGLF
ncbi:MULTISPECIES: SOS response-associated peptidase [unclassified Janthinobacterium]|uniref:SOS response-associated peptidase n=1 Tax=unclassified Janthinobacterium TaxID=2610881 RepID=UPI00160E5532|nr:MULTISPECIES: SOS response-associated peptidase family protein [unclassified Janthinobacterium]MBB5610449.1 putative SOS response-associated peptidase YedK [Janthinobacterium sp. S3T4]MBB5615714.1 putative SOS response-associated peptidase YedK [Janthinobacterium sp. S3M3]